MADVGSAPAARAPLDRGAALLGLLVVWAATLRYLSGLGAILDPMTAMEPYYIHLAGRPLAELLAPGAAWGPLYALWLEPLVAALGDPLLVYRANLALLALGVSSLLYLHLLLLGRRVVPALAAALLFLIGDFNVPLASKVSGFALLVLLAGWSAAAALPRGARRASVVALAALAAAYARPELHPAGLALWAMALWRAIGARRAGDRRALAWPLAGAAAAGGAALAVGLPIGPGSGGGRLLDAFREHFAWNWNRWQGQQWRSYGESWEAAFGGADSLAAALAANPAAVVQHLGDNLLGTLRALAGALRHYPVLAPAARRSMAELETLALTVAVDAGLAALAALPALRRRWLGRYGDFLLAYALAAAPCLAAALLVYPRPHYLAIPAVLLLLGVALAATLLPPAPPLGWPLRLLAAAACVAAVPTPFVLPTAYRVPGSPFLARLAVTRPVTDTVALLRGLGLPPPVHVLTVTDGLGELLGPGFVEIKAWQQGDLDLRSFLRQRHVDVIVNMEPGRHSFVLRDPYWLVVQMSPREAGFVRVPVPGSDHVGVYLRRELAERLGAPTAAEPPADRPRR